jgi:hypothetical protein
MTRLTSLLLALVTFFSVAPAASAAVDWSAPGPHPVTLWGNGTGSSPAVYDGLLRHWASYGFIVAAADTPNSGSGQEILAGLTVLTAANASPGSIYFGKVDTGRVGASGHSQGGGGAIAAGADPRVSVTVPIQPGPSGDVNSLHGPMFILAGQLDIVVVPLLLVVPRYSAATHIPAVYGELAGASHTTPTGNGGGYRGPTTAWFRYWLADDQNARSMFLGPDSSCGLCQDPAWSDVRRNALIPRT